MITIFYLNNENRIYISIMLLITILMPMVPFVHPFIGSSLKYCHLISGSTFLWIVYDNLIFQQTRTSYLFCFYSHPLNCGCRITCKCVESLDCCRHTDNHRHHRQIICTISHDELLHDCGCLTCFTSLHASMSFIYYDIKTITLLLNGIAECIPNSIVASVTILTEVR